MLFKKKSKPVFELRLEKYFDNRALSLGKV